MEEKKLSAIKSGSRIRSFKYAFKGVMLLVLTQPNARIHIAALFAVLGFGLFFEISRLEWALIIFACGLVLTAEAFNTALETLTDLASPGLHPLAGKTKDLAAGAVLIAAVTAFVIGWLVFLPKLLDLIRA